MFSDSNQRMSHSRPKVLIITAENMTALKQAVLDGIKRKIHTARKVIDFDKEVAAGIYVYAIEELGKLILLSDTNNEDGKYRIEYADKFCRHTVKFKLALNYLQQIDKNECLILNDEGSFSADSFSWESFDIGLSPETEARLGVFYVDLDYDTTSHVVVGLKNIPSVDENVLNAAINCLEDVINHWT